MLAGVTEERVVAPDTHTIIGKFSVDQKKPMWPSGKATRQIVSLFLGFSSFFNETRYGLWSMTIAVGVTYNMRKLAFCICENKDAD